MEVVRDRADNSSSSARSRTSTRWAYTRRLDHGGSGADADRPRVPADAQRVDRDPARDRRRDRRPNVQFAINPRDGRMIVIEMNPRVSRSSALASKATDFRSRRSPPSSPSAHADGAGDITAARRRPRSSRRSTTSSPRSALRVQKLPQADSRLTTQMIGRRGDGDRPRVQSSRRCAPETGTTGWTSAAPIATRSPPSYANPGPSACRRRVRVGMIDGSTRSRASTPGSSRRSRRSSPRAQARRTPAGRPDEANCVGSRPAVSHRRLRLLDTNPDAVRARRRALGVRPVTSA